MRRPMAAFLAVALSAIACGTDEGQGSATSTGPAATTPTSHSSSLPGERQDTYPSEGAKLAVAGVAAGDTLKVRSGPGTGYDVVFELAPTAMNATATGHNRSLPDAGYWSEITVDGRTGWANTSYLLQPGDVNDVTAALFPTPPERPTKKTMAELAQAVSRARAGNDPEAKIVVVDGPTVGDVGEISVDVVGVGDDSIGGERLKIFAEPGPGGDNFTVRSVEAMTFCRRGVTEDRRCV